MARLSRSDLLVAAVSVVAVVGATLALTADGSLKPSRPLSTPASVPSTEAPPPLCVPARPVGLTDDVCWKVGARHRFHWDSVDVVELTYRRGAGDPARSQTSLHVEATVVVSAVAGDARGTILSFVAPRADGTVDLGEGDGPQAVAAPLQGEARVEIDRSGRVRSAVVLGHVGDDDREAWRSVIERLVLPTSPSPESTAWVSEEADRHGSCTWDHRMRQDGRFKALTRRRGACRPSLWGGGAGAPSMDTELLVRFDPAVATMVARDRHVLEVGSALRVELRSDARATRTATEAAPTESVDEARAQLRRHAGTLPWGPTGEEDPSSFGGDPVDPESGATRAATLGAMARAAAMRGDVVADVARRAASATDPSTVADLLGVLAAAGTPLAQRALLALATDATLDTDRRRAALLALATIQRPVAEVDGALVSLALSADPVALVAVRVVGAVAGREGPAGARGQALVAAVHASIHSPDPERRLAGLDAWGNLRTTIASPDVLRCAAEGSPSLRQAAVRALRHCVDPAAAAARRYAAIEDTSPAVRHAAVGAVADGPIPERLEVLAHVATSDRSAGVRRRAVTALASAGVAARTTLEAVLRDDPDRVVREAARAALGNVGPR